MQTQADTQSGKVIATALSTACIRTSTLNTPSITATSWWPTARTTAPSSYPTTTTTPSSLTTRSHRSNSTTSTSRTWRRTWVYSRRMSRSSTTHARSNWWNTMPTTRMHFSSNLVCRCERWARSVFSQGHKDKSASNVGFEIHTTLTLLSTPYPSTSRTAPPTDPENMLNRKPKTENAVNTKVPTREHGSYPDPVGFLSLPSQDP